MTIPSETPFSWDGPSVGGVSPSSWGGRVLNRREQSPRVEEQKLAVNVAQLGPSNPRTIPKKPQGSNGMSVL